MINDPTFQEIEFEKLLAEFTTRVRDGELPDIQDYARRFPDLSDQISDLFPLVLQLEGTKQDSEVVERARRWKHPTLDVIGDYSLIREIGRGGMGVVYEARQESLERRVALKVLKEDLASNPQSLARFQREARLAAMLHHTNIVPVLGTGTENGASFIVMPIIDGVGLDQSIDYLVHGRLPPRKNDETPSGIGPQLIAEITEHSIFRSGSRQIDWRKFARIASQLASALAHAHERQVIHRDIKPSNLLIDRSGKPWIVDFGLARISDIGNDATRVAGTPRYMAPEQVYGNASCASDIYAFGLTLYELATRSRVFPEISDSDCIETLKKTPLPPPGTLANGIPQDIQRIVMKCIAVNPADRYRDSAALHDDLERFLDNRPLASARFSPLNRLRRWSQRNPQAAIASAVAVLLLAGIAAMSSVNYWRERELRTRTQDSLGVSIDTLDKVYQRLSPDEESRQPLSEANAQLLNDLLVSYDKLALLDSNNIELKLTAANANYRVGDIHRRLGHPNEAWLAFDEAIRLHRQIVSTEPSHRREAELQISRAMTAQGSMNDSEGRANEKRLKESLEFVEGRLKSEELPEKFRVDFRFEKARILFLLGLSPKRRPTNFNPVDSEMKSQPRGKAVYLGRSIGILEHWSKPWPDRVTALLASGYAERSRKFDDKDSRRSIALQESLVRKNPSSIPFRTNLVDVYTSFDPLYISPREYPRAMTRLKEAIRLGKGLDLNDQRVQVLLKHTHHKIAMIFGKLADDPSQFSAAEMESMLGNATRNPLDEAVKHARKAIEIIEADLSSVERNRPGGLNWLFRFRITLCNFLWKRNQGTDRMEVSEIAEQSRSDAGAINLSTREGKAISGLLKQMNAIRNQNRKLP